MQGDALVQGDALYIFIFAREVTSRSTENWFIPILEGSTASVMQSRSKHITYPVKKPAAQPSPSAHFRLPTAD